jgi:hypothetical protein
MNLKTFLPMGEKPPDTIGRGGDASPIQASLVITFPRFCPVLQELIVLPPATLCSTVCPLIVIILYDTCLPPPTDGQEIALVYFLQFLPANTRHLTTTTAATTTPPTIITGINNITTTTTTYYTTARSLIVAIFYDSCLPRPPAVTFDFGSSLVFLIHHPAQKQQHNTSTPPTLTACLFILVIVHVPAFHLIY